MDSKTPVTYRTRLVSEHMIEYGERVARARKLSRLTQTELGDRLGVSRATIANVEGARQTQNTEQCLAMAEAIGCDPRWLLTGWAEAEPPKLPIKTMRAVVSKTLESVHKELEAMIDGFANER